MRGFWKLTLVELKLMLREPFAAFFTLVFPMMMLFLFGSIYGNTPSPFFGGLGFVDAMVPAYTAMIIATSGMMSLTISMASNREQGILRRYNATPLRPQAILGAQVITIFLMTLIGMAFLIVAGSLVYHLRISGNPASMIGGFFLGCLSFFGLGFVMAGLMPTARSAQLVAMAFYYPMIFLSGSTIPREVLPPGVQNVAKFLPLTWVVNLLRGLWKGDAWGLHLSEVLCLAALFVVGVAISAKTFKWD